MRVECEIEEGEEENDSGVEVDCVYATCGECGHTEMSFGRSDASVRRCLALLRENCPEGMQNYYVGE